MFTFLQASKAILYFFDVNTTKWSCAQVHNALSIALLLRTVSCSVSRCSPLEQTIWNGAPSCVAFYGVSRADQISNGSILILLTQALETFCKIFGAAQSLCLDALEIQSQPRLSFRRYNLRINEPLFPLSPMVKVSKVYLHRK